MPPQFAGVWIMFELFSPLFLWRNSLAEVGSMVPPLEYALVLLAVVVLAEVLVRGAEQFMRTLTGWCLFRFQLTAGALTAAAYLGASAVVYALLTNAYGVHVEFSRFLPLFIMAGLPRILIIYRLLPYLGRTFGVLLNIWTAGLLWRVLDVGYALDAWQNAITCLLALAVFFLVQRLIPKAASSDSGDSVMPAVDPRFAHGSG